MISTVKGVLKKISAKSGSSARGPWTAYSLGVSIDGADEYSWFRYGFKQPPVTEGSVVSFDVTEEKPGIFKVVGEINVDKEATAAAKEPSSSAKSYRGGKSDSVQDSIVRQNAHGSAIACIDSMLKHKIVVAPSGAAKRYEFYKELLATLTDEFFVSNRDAKSVEDIAAENIDPEAEDEGAVDDGGPSDEEAWSPV